jgi:Tfp pilus assembly protein PilN
MVLTVSVALSGIMFFGVSLVKSDESILVSEIKSKEASLANQGGVDQEARDLAANIATISALLDRSVNFSELIQDIGSAIPDGARLTGLSLTGDSSSPLQITAITDTQEKAAIMRKNLEDSEIFSGADIQVITPKDVDGVRTYTAIFVASFATEEKPKTTNNLPNPNDEVPEEQQD